MHDTSLNRLLQYFDLSWDGYRKVRKGVKKRIVRHMQNLRINSIEDYLEIIKQDAQARNICFRLLSVSISRFFRDKKLWESLEKELIPVLLSEFPERKRFKVWSCGCARGEEVYSILMVWESLANSGYIIPQLDILATDLNPEYLEMASKGVYDFRSLKNLPESFIKKYFIRIPGKNKFQIHGSLKEKVVFKQHDFIEEFPPWDNFQIIFLRNNLLTYYDPQSRDAAFERVVATLLPGGVMIVGSHEKVPQNISFLKRHPKSACVYFKQKS